MTNVPDALFPSDNLYGIPRLSMEYQGDFVDLPVRGWGQIARRSSMRGTWHFYVEDNKFAALWKHPEALLKTGALTSVEPNYTVDDQMPLAVGLFKLYQKRWTARYWQEMGVRIFVDLYVSPKYYQYALLGVPKGWKAYATRACDNKIDQLIERAGLAMERAEGSIKFLVYGTGAKVKELCGERDWIFVEDAGNYNRKAEA